MTTRACLRMTPLLYGALLVACSTDRASDAASGDDATRLPLAVRAALDSGNTAMRAKDYTGAIVHYRVAAAGAPQHAAPWFGMHMAARALENASLADSAMRMVQRLTNDSATLPSHEEVAAAAMPSHGAAVLPQGHPPTPAASAPHPPTGRSAPSKP